MIKVFADSTSSIPKEMREKLGIDLLSLFVNRNGVDYDEGKMDLDEFYTEIYDMIDNPPTSSQPSVSTMEETFEEAARNGDQVLGVFISSFMSGTFENALTAAKRVAQKIPDFKYAIVDSMSNCMELGWAAISGAKARNEGLSLEKCVEKIKHTSNSTRFIFAPESLKFLEKGGRIGKASALLGNLLSITPILTVNDGIADTLAKVRTQKNAKSKMVKTFKSDIEACGLKNAVVHYIGSAKPAIEWAKAEVEPLIGQEVLVVPASPVIGVHVGPAIGIAYECVEPIPGKYKSTTPEIVIV